MYATFASSYTTAWAPSSTSLIRPVSDKQHLDFKPTLQRCFWNPKVARDITCQKSSNFICPPLNTQHDHAGDGQAEVRAPVQHALFRPACVDKKWTFNYSHVQKWLDYVSVFFSTIRFVPSPRSSPGNISDQTGICIQANNLFWNLDRLWNSWIPWMNSCLSLKMDVTFSWTPLTEMIRCLFSNQIAYHK